jgi:dihydroflavonol-4-reductase
MKALVTGAAGLIGSHVVRDLLRENAEVRALVLPGENPRNLEGLDIERVEGDVRDADAMARAVRGCRAVFHLAAIYALWLPRMSKMEEVNVGGTRNVMRACLDEGVERVVHTSSFVVFAGQSVERDSNEESPFVNQDAKNLYAVTKHRSQQIALDYHGKGLDVVIAAPCGTFGPNDVGPTPTGRLILSLVHYPVIPVVNSINNMADARDVAKGHILAWRKGRSGEAYILGNENIWASDLAKMVNQVADLDKKLVPIPTWLVKFSAHFMLAWSEYVSRKPPLVDPTSVEIGARGMRMDCSKAFNQLGLPRRPLTETIRDALVWFAQNGYVKCQKARGKILAL